MSAKTALAIGLSFKPEDWPACAGGLRRSTRTWAARRHDLDHASAAEDFALLTVARNSSADTYPDDVHLVTIEFRYATS